MEIVKLLSASALPLIVKKEVLTESMRSMTSLVVLTGVSDSLLALVEDAVSVSDFSSMLIVCVSLSCVPAVN